MMMTSQAQLQGMIAAQAGMMSFQARSMFLGMAAGLQARVSMNESAQRAAMAGAMQRSLDMQRAFQANSAILAMRNRGIENAFAMQRAVKFALVDSAKSSQRMAMLQAEAAHTSGQAPAGQAAAPPQPPDDAPLAAEPPPMMVRPTFGNALVVDKPKFSVESGVVAPGTKVRIKCDTHYATLYYTTNGWTPTTQSAKYTGPITIDSTTHLQVIAVGPNFLRSSVERADYLVKTLILLRSIPQ